MTDAAELRAVDLLAEAIDQARPILTDEILKTKTKVRAIWAACRLARNMGAPDAVKAAFLQLATETGLIDRAGRWTGDDVRESVKPFGRDDIAHVIDWALRGRNPFEEGPLK